MTRGATGTAGPGTVSVPRLPGAADGGRLSTVNAGPRPAVAGFGTATPPNSYTQREMLDLFRIEDPRIRSVFLNSAIERRYLTLPPELADGTRKTETQGELLAKHKEQGVRTAAEALETALKRAGLALADIGYLCCVTTTGLLTPGFSALLIRELGLPVAAGRLDVVGMGCNAGLNALNAVASWSAANPGQAAVMVCAEVCSAAYVFDGTMRTAVVNSLFGDGAAAVVLVTDPGGKAPEEDEDSAPRATLLKFASRIIPEAVAAMRYDWDDTHGKFSFFLDRDVPYVVGAHAEEVVGRLLAGTGLRRADIGHWLVHSGGKKVIDSVKVNLGLSPHAVRHTTGVLRDYGNLSSGSFLFSYERLMEEGRVRRGDYGVLMTMGPGSTIETALVQW
ncbi:type III polyketide synthase [Streptomyces sp. GMY02]|uniref:3,5-dihydroxyphenylacetyl-CoA synthase DpgA n=1 Tax=Streptomyces sp. GMY02 TaxID=1333528 RepID=UPI001C2C1337|nr:3,5-dihydroxyphenylacetyl-CoA synthase DpgA [Streptomyces sp. GMY02]QXE33744.1 type III polyketide synthase [Streptomyces sp. GMY02]